MRCTSTTPSVHGKTQPGGHQFTLIGNAVSAPAKWGITVHNSHYGLVQDNIVYGAHGAAIVTEDGTESFNVFDHNFAVRAEGAGDRAPRGGYGGSGPDPGSDGSGFWFQGPNNYIRNNVAANAEASGFNLAGRLLGTVRIPAFQERRHQPDRRDQTGRRDGRAGARVREQRSLRRDAERHRVRLERRHHQFPRLEHRALRIDGRAERSDGHRRPGRQGRRRDPLRRARGAGRRVDRQLHARNRSSCAMPTSKACGPGF